MREAIDLRGVFGWSLPFRLEIVGDEIAALMHDAGVLTLRNGLQASKVRVSTLGDTLVAHSAYPTTQSDAVFFGPDSYRFARFLQTELPKLGAIAHLVDIGTGAGAGAIAAMQAATIAHISATDINAEALVFAGTNLAHAKSRPGASPATTVQTHLCDGLQGIDASIDCIIANPPYIADPAHRAYRDGGAMHGGAVSLAWARAAARRLAPGGALLLYTGSAIVDGEDRLKTALVNALAGFDVRYWEIDPDVFGEELERPDYADVERIAVVGLVAVKR